MPINITSFRYVPISYKRNGHYGFVDFTLNDTFCFKDIAIYKLLNPENNRRFRLVYPENSQKRAFFHPIDRNMQMEIDIEITKLMDTINIKD